MLLYLPEWTYVFHILCKNNMKYSKIQLYGTFFSSSISFLKRSGSTYCYFLQIIYFLTHFLTISAHQGTSHVTSVFWGVWTHPYDFGSVLVFEGLRTFGTIGLLSSFIFHLSSSQPLPLAVKHKTWPYRWEGRVRTAFCIGTLVVVGHSFCTDMHEASPYRKGGCCTWGLPCRDMHEALCKVFYYVKSATIHICIYIVVQYVSFVYNLTDFT